MPPRRPLIVATNLCPSANTTSSFCPALRKLPSKDPLCSFFFFFFFPHSRADVFSCLCRFRKDTDKACVPGKTKRTGSDFRTEVERLRRIVGCCAIDYTRVRIDRPCVYFPHPLSHDFFFISFARDDDATKLDVELINTKLRVEISRRNLIDRNVNAATINAPDCTGYPGVRSNSPFHSLFHLAPPPRPPSRATISVVLPNRALIYDARKSARRMHRETLPALAVPPK